MATGNLYIDNQLVDLPPNESVKITRAFIDTQNPEGRNGDVSLPIKLPKTANNCRIFNNVQVENIQDKFVKTQEHLCRYHVSGDKILFGIIRILQITTKDFECTMASSNVAWSKLLNGLTLRDLKNDDNITPWSTPFFGLSGASTPYSINWYNENTTFSNSPIAFPLVSYGTFFSGEQDAFVNGIWDDSLSLEDIPPSVYDLAIVRQIFRNLGWRIDSPVFANSEARNLVMPYTTTDRYEYNYGQIINAHASGNSMVYFGIPTVQNYDFNVEDTHTITSVYPANNGVNMYKRMGIGHIKFPTFIYNPHQNFKPLVGQTILGSTQQSASTGQTYQTPVSTQYNFDIDIRNWQLMVSGRTHYATAPTDAQLLTYVQQAAIAAGQNPAGASVYPNITEAYLNTTAEAACGIERGIYSREVCLNAPTTDYMRAGFVIFLDDPTDVTRKDVIFREVCNYVYNVYDGSPASITHNSVLAAYFPTHTGSTNYWQPYDSNANISVIDDLTKTFTTQISFPCNPGPYLIGQYFGPGIQQVFYPSITTTDLLYRYNFTGNTKFEFRDFEIPAGEQIKIMFVAPIYQVKPGAASAPITLKDEVNSLFTCSYVDFNFDILDENGNSPNPNNDIDLNIAKNLPAIGQLEWIKTFIARNNLFITADVENKTLRLENFDDYFLPIDFAEDITEDIDNNFGAPATKPVQLPKNLFFRYENDTSDVLLYQDPDFANLQITSDNIYSENDKTINQLFSSTKTREFLVNSAYNIVSLLPVTLPSIANEENYSNLDLTSVQWTFAYSPRILKLDGFATFDDLVGNPETPIYVDLGGYPYKIMKSRFEDTRPGRLNLRFDTDNGLYRTFYQRYLNNLDDSYILMLNSKINSARFNRLQPNVPVIVNGQSYILNLISNFDTINPGITKIELIKRFTN